MDLPITKYHPDPVATGSVEANPDQPCLCCNRIRGYIYTGPAYSERFHYLSECLCPRCVADGSAAQQFGAEFTDTETLEDVPKAVLEELAKRTPGFRAWANPTGTRSFLRGPVVFRTPVGRGGDRCGTINPPSLP